MSGRKKLPLLLTLWTGIFCNYACYSIIAPFFPQLARKRGLSAEEYSLVFATYSASQVLFSLIVGRNLVTVGAKFALVSGLFLTGVSSILFGCLEHSPGGMIFLGLSSAVRAVEGAGFAAYLTGAMAVLVESFPADPGYYVGLTESVVTAAMVAGPPLGSVLYTIGGYAFPFVCLGGFLMTVGITSAIVLPSSQTPNPKCNAQRRGEWKKFMLSLAALTAVASVVCNVSADAFVLISLSERLQRYGLSPIGMASVYLCLFASYGISSPAAGKLSDTLGRAHFLLQAFGCLVVSGAFLLLGPIPILKPRLSLIVGGLLLKGLGAGPLVSCSFSAALAAARRIGMPADFRTYSLVSTTIAFAIPLGNLIGGATTGVLCERLGIVMSCNAYAGLFMILAIICSIVHFVADSERKRKLNVVGRVDVFGLLEGECHIPLIETENEEEKE